MLPSHFAVVGWFPAAKVVAARQSAAPNVLKTDLIAYFFLFIYANIAICFIA